MVGYIVYFTAIICGLLWRRSKFISALMITSMWIIMGLNTQNADFDGYRLYYDLQMEVGSNLTKGYVASERIGWLLGLDYIGYRMLFSAIGLILLYRFISRVTEDVSFVLSLYMIMPFLYDVVQFKFFLASMLSLTAISFLFTDMKLNYLCFTFFLLLATLMHSASILYSFFLVLSINKKHSTMISIVLFCIVLFLVYTGVLRNLLSEALDSAKSEAYLSTMSRFGSISYFISTFILILITRLTQNEIETSDTIQLLDLETEGQRSNQFLAFYSIGVMALLPLVAMVPMSVQNFYRPIRSILLLFYLYFDLTFFGKKHVISKQGKSLLQVSFVLWFVVTYYIVMFHVRDSVIQTELTHNLLW